MTTDLKQLYIKKELVDENLREKEKLEPEIG